MSGDSMKMDGQELEFPVDWEYRIVVEADQIDAARAAVRKCLESHGVFTSLEDGLSSSGGRYLTLRAGVTLDNREMMNHLSSELGNIAGVKFLL